MNKKSINLVLAIVLIVAFFLPFISFGGIFSASGFNVVFGKSGMSGIVSNPKLLLVSVLIPLGALLVLFDSLGGGTSNLDYGYWMPLVGVIALTLLMYFGMKSGAGSEFNFGEFIKVLGYGYWITLVASVVLAFNKPK